MVADAQNDEIYSCYIVCGILLSDVSQRYEANFNSNHNAIDSELLTGDNNNLLDAYQTQTQSFTPCT